MPYLTTIANQRQRVPGQTTVRVPTLHGAPAFENMSTGIRYNVRKDKSKNGDAYQVKYYEVCLLQVLCHKNQDVVYTGYWKLVGDNEWKGNLWFDLSAR